SRITGRPTGRYAITYQRIRTHPWNQAMGHRWSKPRAVRSSTREPKAGRNIPKTPYFPLGDPCPWECPECPSGSFWGAWAKFSLEGSFSIRWISSCVLQHVLDMGVPFISPTLGVREFLGQN